MEGETALFRKGEHPLNSKKGGTKGREDKQRERTSEGKEKAAMHGRQSVLSLTNSSSVRSALRPPPHEARAHSV